MLFRSLPGSARLSEISEITTLLETQEFDIALIDTASSLSALTVQLIKAADLIIIPITSSFISIRSALHIKDFIGAEDVKKIRILDCGMSSEARTQLSSDFTILEPGIRKDEQIRANELSKVSILTSAPHSASASDYREIGYSILDELGMI